MKFTDKIKLGTVTTAYDAVKESAVRYNLFLGRSQQGYLEHDPKNHCWVHHHGVSKLKKDSYQYDDIVFLDLEDPKPAVAKQHDHAQHRVQDGVEGAMRVPSVENGDI